MATAFVEPCARCLKDTTAPVEAEFEEEALPSIDIDSGLPVDTSEEPDVLRLDDHRELDLETVREAISLAEPRAALPARLPRALPRRRADPTIPVIITTTTPSIRARPLCGPCATRWTSRPTPTGGAADHLAHKESLDPWESPSDESRPPARVTAAATTR
ncbi:MAG: hypothetical protein U0869_17800 [Chloroflexota bacterium]